MSGSIDRRHFLGIAAATGLSTGLSGQTVGAVAAALRRSDGSDAGGVSRQARSFLTEARRLRRREPWQPQASHAQRGSSFESPSNAADLAARDRKRWIVHGRSARPARGRHRTRPGWAQRAGEDTRRQVLESDAVQQHPLPAGPGALGRRAVTRRHRARRQGRQRPSGVLLGLPQ